MITEKDFLIKIRDLEPWQIADEIQPFVSSLSPDERCYVNHALAIILNKYDAIKNKAVLDEHVTKYGIKELHRILHKAEDRLRELTGE